MKAYQEISSNLKVCYENVNSIVNFLLARITEFYNIYPKFNEHIVYKA